MSIFIYIKKQVFNYVQLYICKNYYYEKLNENNHLLNEPN
jgi:hypothetical protein